MGLLKRSCSWNPLNQIPCSRVTGVGQTPREPDMRGRYPLRTSSLCWRLPKLVCMYVWEFNILGQVAPSPRRTRIQVSNVVGHRSPRLTSPPFSRGEEGSDGSTCGGCPHSHGHPVHPASRVSRVVPAPELGHIDLGSVQRHWPSLRVMNRPHPLGRSPRKIL